MNRPTRAQWIVLWLGAFWVLLSLVVADDYVVRAAVAGFIVTALLYWQLSPHEQSSSAPSQFLDRRPSNSAIASSSSPPSADSPPTNDGPDSEFIGEVLAANFLFEHFQLKEDDLLRLTSELPAELTGPARLWITIYACWLYRMSVRAKYGDEFFDAAFDATRRRLERKVDGVDGRDFVHALEFWFDKLDNATKSLGTKFQEVETTFRSVRGLELPRDGR